MNMLMTFGRCSPQTLCIHLHNVFLLDATSPPVEEEKQVVLMIICCISLAVHQSGEKMNMDRKLQDESF